MTVYSYLEAREHLATLLEQALSEGQVKLRGRDGRVFVIQPDPSQKSSPLDVPSLQLPITKVDILEAIQDGHARL